MPMILFFTKISVFIIDYTSIAYYAYKHTL
jgi:hypothetical protein